jgi:hypothetical protein
MSKLLELQAQLKAIKQGIKDEKKNIKLQVKASKKSLIEQVKAEHKAEIKHIKQHGVRPVKAPLIMKTEDIRKNDEDIVAPKITKKNTPSNEDKRQQVEEMINDGIPVEMAEHIVDDENKLKDKPTLTQAEFKYLFDENKNNHTVKLTETTDHINRIVKEIVIELEDQENINNSLMFDLLQENINKILEQWNIIKVMIVINYGFVTLNEDGTTYTNKAHTITIYPTKENTTERKIRRFNDLVKLDFLKNGIFDFSRENYPTEASGGNILFKRVYVNCYRVTESIAKGFIKLNRPLRSVVNPNNEDENCLK